jgi:polyhydroxyalkanoate synthase
MGRTVGVADGSPRRATVTRLQPKARVRAPESAPPTAQQTQLLRDSYGSTALAEVLDRSLHAGIARLTTGVAPMTLSGAYADWASHLGVAPGKQMQLSEKAVRVPAATHTPCARRWKRKTAHRASAAGAGPALRGGSRRQPPYV